MEEGKSVKIHFNTIIFCCYDAFAWIWCYVVRIYVATVFASAIFVIVLAIYLIRIVIWVWLCAVFAKAVFEVVNAWNIVWIVVALAVVIVVPLVVGRIKKIKWEIDTADIFRR